MKVININGRGNLPQPKELQQRFGFEKAGQIIAEETADGILLRNGATSSIEIYSNTRADEFTRNNEAAVARYQFKTK